MRTYKFSNVMMGLFILLFINANVNAQYTLPNFTRYRQDINKNNTCWAASIRMVMKYYGTDREEEEIIRFAFRLGADEPTPDATRTVSQTRDALNSLLLGAHPTLVHDTLAPNLVTQIIRDDRPIIAAWQSYADHGNAISNQLGHMNVIVGYTGSGGSDIGNVIFANPLDSSEFQELLYSRFVYVDTTFFDSTTNRNVLVKREWLGSIYPINRPPARRQTIVGKLGSKFNTIMAALRQTQPNELVHVIDAETYEEQVIFDYMNDGVTLQPTIRSDGSSIRPRIKYFKGQDISPSPPDYGDFSMQSLNSEDISNIADNSAVRIISFGYGYPSMRIHAFDIEGSNAVYNTGTAYISESSMSATSSIAIYNAGIMTLDNTTVFTASDTAIYNTRSLNIIGTTVLSAAYGDNGTAIYNSVGALLSLGGSPTITGRIAGPGRLRVYASGVNRFTPGSRRYVLALTDLRNGEIVVYGGADFINNFELTDPNFYFVADGNDLVARIRLQNIVSEMNSGDTLTIPTGPHDLEKCLIVPDSVSNVVLRFQPGTELRFTEGAREIWAGTTGTILGAENLTIYPQVILYNTPTPREPVLPEDRVIGLFSNLCDAIWRGQGGRTIKVGPGIYNFSSIGGQGLIGVMHQNRDSSSILRFGFGDSPAGCERVSYGITTLIRGMRLEFNGDVYTEDHPDDAVLTTHGYGGKTIFENCVFEARYSDPARKEVVAHQLGAAGQYFGGEMEYKNCVFVNFKTAVLVNDPMRPEESPVFTKSIFADNITDLRFTVGSRALCEISSNQIKSMAVGQTIYAGASIDSLISDICGNTGISGPNLSAANPGFIDPLISDYRLSNRSPLIGTGIGLVDMGMEMVFIFSDFLNGSVDFGRGRTLEFVNGAITSNKTGFTASLRFTYTLNLRPVYELKFSGDIVNTVTEVNVAVWKKDRNMPTSFLSDEYAIWDASVNGIQFGNMTRGELYPGAVSGNGRVSKRVYPNVNSPAPVAGFDAVDKDEDVVLAWNRSTESGMSRYKLFRAPAAAPYRTSQIASLPADVTEYRDAGQNKADYIYSIVAYDSTGNMSAHVGGNKLYSFSGFDAAQRDTLRVTPEGITVIVQNPDFQHGAMFTVRNRGHNDSLVVEWYGVRDQNHTDCESRSVNLFVNGAQINNIASPKMGNGLMMFNLRSAVKESYLVDVEIFNWRNGRGCQ